MCLLFIAINRHPDYPLVIAGNRDEFYRRPTEKLSFWKDHPGLLAGRDLEAGGTWLGVTRSGRIAAITNYRDPARVKENAPSRGRLVLDFLAGSSAPPDFCRENAERMAGCNGFNLVFGDVTSLYYYSNRGQGPVAPIADGLHGLSNHLLNTPWPKVEKGKQRLAQLLNTPGPLDPESVFSLLQDRETAPDNALPQTGVGLDWERKLSPLFIVTDVYGTRSSSVITVDRENRVTFSERTFTPDALGRLAVSTETLVVQAESSGGRI
ncbi:MAG: NRDE family protein [Thermodesulfobacteriota bacterium]